ncbi:MAG TPA: DUF5103 domain-containing protein [Chitinophagales bacterium]|nr:DUF5103 domain-containing protein [Chitinophagales bacterium]
MNHPSIRHSICCVFFPLLSAFLGIGQNQNKKNIYPPASLQYDNCIYKKEIKTIQLRDPNFELSKPAIGLNSGEVLELSFDDLSYELQNYSYTFIHCNANWEPSSLMSSEFIDGFADNSINNYRYSANTLQKYIHYSTTFPTNSTRFTKSGNYILKVYQNSDPDDLVLTRRFMIYDNKVNITGNISAASIIADRNYSQEIDFTINHVGYEINNPYGDLKIFILQNDHWNGAKSDLKPVYVKDQELVFDYDQENVFPGGNEFRNFDIKSIRYHSEHIAAVRTDTLVNHVYLFADEKRAFKQYSSQQDINGNFVIKTDEGSNNETDADYCFVSFFLKNDGNLPEGDLYVFGAFNGWQCTPENRMKFNPERMGYEGLLQLKQGYYNYEYVFMNDKQKADETVIEGSHAVTENDYTILVYHRFPGTFYDQLIAVKRLNSRKDH